MKTLAGYILMGIAALACPCHLVVTLPLILAVLGGTAVGAFLAQNPSVVFGFFTVAFVAALWGGMTLLSRRDAAQDECATCASEPQHVAPVDAVGQSAQTEKRHERILAGMRRR